MLPTFFFKKKEKQEVSLPPGPRENPLPPRHLVASRLSVACGEVAVEITVRLSGSDNRHQGATGTWCLIN